MDTALQQEAEGIGDLRGLVLAHDRQRLERNATPIAREDVRRRSHRDGHACTGIKQVPGDIDPSYPHRR